VRLLGREKDLEAAGARVAAISVDPPEASRALLERLAADDPPAAIDFPVLSDPGGAVARAYGVYDARHEIALPATIIVRAPGEVTWKHVGETVTDRPLEDDILDAVRRGAGAATTATATSR
jgi:peroxiredoxin